MTTETSGYRLLRHRGYDHSIEPLPQSVHRKAIWSQVLLGTRGRTPNVKSTSGYNARWRRTPVQGYHYYLWWIPLSESGFADRPDKGDEKRTILIHSIRHHDATDDPIAVASLDEYEEIVLAGLDPRFDEQRAVAEYATRGPVSLATVKGLPGSGKTVALFYLVRDLAGHSDLNNILYVTYTGRLKRAAQEFFAAQESDAIKRIRVRTFHEAMGEILGVTVPHIDPLGDLGSFERFLETQHPSSLGAWRRYPQTLYTELRAFFYGRRVPDKLTFAGDTANRLFWTAGATTPEAYAAARNLDLTEAELIYRLSQRLRDSNFFLDQRTAAQALTALRRDRLPGWIRTLDALIFDEVQDLTLLQIAVVGELAQARLRARVDTPLVVAVAGDESQIVQPSGFDWGATKDLLRDILNVDPVEFEFRHQRRSPRNLAQLIDNAWNFYVRLPKQLRPSANRQSFVDDAGHRLMTATAGSDVQGRILLCPPSPDQLSATDTRRQRWQAMVDELGRLPGRALVDLTETLNALLALPNEQTGEAVFLAREIKGLERSTVLVFGLNRLYVQIARLSEDTGDPLSRLEARRLIDQIRVALSRSTDTLVLLEPADAPVLDELQVAEIPSHYEIEWDALLDLLHNEEMSDIEIVEGYLDEVDDLLERRRWEDARQRNRRAYDLAALINDRSLLRDAADQHIHIFLLEAADKLERQEIQRAYGLNRQAFDLAESHGDPQLLDEVEEQYRSIAGASKRRIDAILAEAEKATNAGDHAAAHQMLYRAADLLSVMHDERLQVALDERIVACGWQWGLHLRTTPTADNATKLSNLFKELADTMRRQADTVGAQLADVIAERYRTLPPTQVDGPDLIKRLLRHIDDYLETVAPLDLGHEALLFVETWLEEAFAQLGDHREIFYNWAVLAQTYATLADYPSLDDHLWDLENRVALVMGPTWQQDPSEDAALTRFAAFIATYNGDAAQASLAWEQLGLTELAVEQARVAGEIERAHMLLRKAGAQQPEELSIAVKLLRLAEQMQSKQGRLYPAERTAVGSRARQIGDISRGKSAG